MPVKTKSPRGELKNLKKINDQKLIDITERTRKSIEEKFTEEQLVEFQELFNMFDKDNQGVLSVLSLATAMKAVGQTPTESDMIDLMREIDLDNSGTIDFYEFVNLISQKMHPNETQDEIHYAFKLFDRNSDGFITADDLQSTVEKYLGLILDDAECARMIDSVDRNDQRKVSFDDFLHVVICETDRKN